MTTMDKYQNLEDKVEAKSRERSHLRHLDSPEDRKRLRQQSGLSQQDVADHLGVTREAVTRWESGLRTPRGQLLDDYCDLLEWIKNRLGLDNGEPV